MAPPIMKSLLGLDKKGAAAPPDAGDDGDAPPNPFDALQPEEMKELASMAQDALDAGEFEYTPAGGDIGEQENEPDVDVDDKGIPGEPGGEKDPDADEPTSADAVGSIGTSDIADEAMRVATEAAACATAAAASAEDAKAYRAGNPSKAAKAAKAAAKAADEAQSAAQDAQDAAGSEDWGAAGEALQAAQDAYQEAQEAADEAASFTGAPGLTPEGKGAKAASADAKGGKGAPASKTAPAGKAAPAAPPPKKGLLAWRDGG